MGPPCTKAARWGGQLHVPVPGDLSALGPRHRQAVATGIGDGQRLEAHPAAPGLGLQCRPGCADQGGAERQEPGSVAGGPLREQNDELPFGQPMAHGGADGGGCPAPLPVDVDRPLQPREGADQRPAGDLGLRHEGERPQRPHRDDIQPRDVIGEHQGRLAGGRGCSALHDPHPEQAQESTVEQDRRQGRAATQQPQGDPVRRPQHREGEAESRDAPSDTEAAHGVTDRRSSSAQSHGCRRP